MLTSERSWAVASCSAAQQSLLEHFSKALFSPPVPESSRLGLSLEAVSQNQLQAATSSVWKKIWEGLLFKVYF